MAGHDRQRSDSRRDAQTTSRSLRVGKTTAPALRPGTYCLNPRQCMIKNPLDTALEKHLDYLKLPYLKENCRPFAAEGNTKHWSHIDYLARLIEGEAAARHDRTILHRIKAARFPVIKTLESFRWDWPKKINQLQIQDLFRLRFIDEKANAIFLGLCGIGTMPGDVAFSFERQAFWPGIFRWTGGGDKSFQGQ